MNGADGDLIWVGVLCGAQPPPRPAPPYLPGTRLKPPPPPPPPPFLNQGVDPALGGGIFPDGMPVYGRLTIALLPLIMLFWIWFTPITFSLVYSVFDSRSTKLGIILGCDASVQECFVNAQ